MADLKTKKTDLSVDDYVGLIEDPAMRADCERLAVLFREVTGDAGKVWNAGMAGSGGMAGFGDYYYRGAGGRTGVWFATGFSPRKANLTLYLTSGFDFHEAKNLLAVIGKHKLGKGCLYVKRLDDLDPEALRALATACWTRSKASSDRIVNSAEP